MLAYGSLQYKVQVEAKTLRRESLKKPSLITLLVILLVVGSVFVAFGLKNLEEYRSGFKPIFPDGIQIYGDPDVRDLTARFDFVPREGTKIQTHSSVKITLEFRTISVKEYVFYVTMPYHVNWIQNFSKPNTERWGYVDHPFGGSLINATILATEPNTFARIYENFGFDKPISVQDRGLYTTIIPVHVTSDIRPAVAGITGFDRIPTTVDVFIPELSVPRIGDSFPSPDQIILREDEKGGRSKHLIWYLPPSEFDDPGQTVLASYILTEVKDDFDRKLFLAALLLAVGVSAVISSSVEMSKLLQNKERKASGC